MSTPDAGSALRAVSALHEALEAWQGGTESHSTRAIAVHGDAFHPDFERINPDGTVTGRQHAVDEFERTWALRPGLRIEIHEAHEIVSTERLAVVRYHVRRHGGGPDDRRYATAVLTWLDRRWLWLTLQETTQADPG